MAYLAGRPRVMPAAIALVLSLPFGGCGSITGVTSGDAGPAFTDAGPVSDGGGAEAGETPPRDAAPEAAPDAAPDADTRRCAFKVNEVQAGGALAALDEFIELHNPCPDRSPSLSGYQLVYRSEAGTTNVVLIAFGAQAVVADRPFFLCANSNSAYTGPAADAYYTASGLRDVGGGIALLDATGQVVDSVGWGTATNAFVETIAAPAPLGGQSIARVPDGRDTDVNATDFATAAVPTPGAPN